jgi:hypothetical protein
MLLFEVGRTVCYFKAMQKDRRFGVILDMSLVASSVENTFMVSRMMKILAHNARTALSH